MRHVRPSALALALLLLFSLTACKPAADQPSAAPSQAAASPAPSSQEPSQAPSQSPSLADDETPDIRFAVLSGPTGVGAAKLLDSAAAYRESGGGAWLPLPPEGAELRLEPYGGIYCLAQ